VKETILFDIDYTLLNTHIFKENYRNRIAKFLGISVEEFSKVEKGYVQRDIGFTDFNPEEYISFISRKHSASTSDVAKAFFDSENFKVTLYPEVTSVLENLSGDYKLGIFSEGLNDFQLLKLHKSGILKYFDQKAMFIFRRKLTQESLDLLPTGCFVVDDNNFVVEALCKISSFKPIWLNRKTNEKHPKCVTIFDLTNLRETLESYSTI